MIELVLILLLSRPVRVTWVAHTSQLTACQSSQPKVNPYSGEFEMSLGVTAMACFAQQTIGMSRDLVSVTEAAEFMDAAPQCQMSVVGQGQITLPGTTCVSDMAMEPR